jgi:hypothetical protein
MNNSPDPTVHREREEQFINHVEQLLEDDRLRVDTTRGRRSVLSLIRDVNRSTREVELKRQMSQAGMPDRELEGRMPRGQTLDVLLSQSSWILFKKPVGRLRVVCLSPVKALLSGQPPKPLTTPEVNRLLAEMPPPLPGIPTTLILMSTSGFTTESHEVADRTASCTLILVEPNPAGGWSIAAPAQSKALAELFDPEGEVDKRQRIFGTIDDLSMDLTGSGIIGDKIAAQTQLPIMTVEAEIKNYAKEHPGLTAKRLDGRLVLFREGVTPTASSAGNGATEMSLMDRIRSLFAHKGETEKKIAFLSERRTLLSGQRDRGYEELGSLDGKEVELRDQFKAARTPMTKRRITSQLLQLHKEMERRQQLLQVLNQQINVVGTHLHNLELTRQGQTAQLPDSEELAADAAAAEDVLAQLEVDSELANSVGSVSLAGMSAEEQALFDELEAESGASHSAARPQAEGAGPATPAAPAVAPEPGQTSQRAGRSEVAPPARPQRNEPEAG